MNTDILYNVVKKLYNNDVMLSEAVYNQPGCAGHYFRDLISELCVQVGVARYLEVGVFYGATLAAAMCRSPGRFVGVENFSQFQGSMVEVETGVVAPVRREEQIQWIAHAINSWGEGRAKIIEADHLKVNLGEIRDYLGLANVFLYDGDHSAEATKAGIEYYFPVCADEFILVVDDYSDEKVKLGTQQAINSGVFDLIDARAFEFSYNEDGRIGYSIYAAYLIRKSKA